MSLIAFAEDELDEEGLVEGGGLELCGGGEG